MRVQSSYSQSSTRPYSFQAQEHDDEVKGDGNSVNFSFRMHDPRLGRFFAIDPLANEYPYNSSYAFSENSVISFMEFEGLETIKPFRQNFDSKLKFQGQTSGESYNLPGLKTNVVKIEQWKQNENGTYDLYKVIYRDVNSSKEFSVESYAQVSKEKIADFLNPWRPPFKPGGPGDPEWEMRSSGGIQSATILEPVMEIATEGVSSGLQGAGVGKEDADKAAGVITCLGTIILCKKLGSVSGGKAPTGSGTSLARTLGTAGETAVGTTGSKVRIPSLTGTANYRIPDQMTDFVLKEVKNVKSQGLTCQIKDFLLYSQQTGRSFELYTRPTTKITKPLQNEINNGNITKKTIPGM